MSSEQFRRQLRREAESWRKEGRITSDQFDWLAGQYQFNALEVGARDRFILVLISLGSVLLGLGAITFVAANWQAISRAGKLALLMALFLGVSILGYQLWKRPAFSLPALANVSSEHSSTGYRRENWQNRLGHALLLMAALLLGANLALTGQLFHVGGAAYDLCFAWGLGVLAMAYGLRLASLGVLAIALVGLGYWLAFRDVIFQAGISDGFALVMEYMPLLAGVLFLPVAYLCRSKIVFVGAAIAVLTSFMVIVLDFSRLFPNGMGLVLAIALTLPPTLLWGYDDSLWHRLFRRPNRPTHLFQTTAQALSLIWFIITLGILSFHWLWLPPTDLVPLPQQVSHLLTQGLPLLLNPNFIVLTLFTVLGWVSLAYSRRTHRWEFVSVDAIMLLFFGILALMMFWHWSVSPVRWFAVYMMNLLYFLVAIGFLRRGLGEGDRTLFWCGLAMATLQILSRTLEYETGLLLKSLMFILCGVGVILIGLWFERYVRTLASTPNSPSS